MKKFLAILMVMAITISGVFVVVYYKLPSPGADMAIFFISTTGSLTSLFLYFENKKKVTRWED